MSPQPKLQEPGASPEMSFPHPDANWFQMTRAKSTKCSSSDSFHNYPSSRKLRGAQQQARHLPESDPVAILKAMASLGCAYGPSQGFPCDWTVELGEHTKKVKPAVQQRLVWGKDTTEQHESTLRPASTLSPIQRKLKLCSPVWSHEIIADCWIQSSAFKQTFVQFKI